MCEMNSESVESGKDKFVVEKISRTGKSSGWNKHIRLMLAGGAATVSR